MFNDDDDVVVVSLCPQQQQLNQVQLLRDGIIKILSAATIDRASGGIQISRGEQLYNYKHTIVVVVKHCSGLVFCVYTRFLVGSLVDRRLLRRGELGKFLLLLSFFPLVLLFLYSDTAAALREYTHTNPRMMEKGGK